MIRLTAPDGKKLRNIKTERLYSEVICDEKKRYQYVIADSPEDPTVEELDGVTLADRVANLENTVTELTDDTIPMLTGCLLEISETVYA